MVDHASQCESCALLIAGISPEEEVSEEEIAEMPNLASQNPEWKESMLRRMTAHQSGNPALEKPVLDVVPRRRASVAWWLAAAAVIVIAFSSWLWTRSNSPDEAFRLLAQSYSEQRPFSYRIPGASPDGSQRRGGAADDPVALKKALALTADHQEGGASQWRRAGALGNLLQGKYAVAIPVLEALRAAEPGNADALSDLAIAYLIRAQAESLPRDRTAALDLLEEAREARPTDAVLLFNLALVTEDLMPGTAEAIESWNRFLRVESSGGWADEAHRHRADQQQKKDAKGTAISRPQPEDSIFVLARNGFSRSSELDPQEVAKLLLDRHGDPWLTELLSLHDRSSEADRTSELLAQASAATADTSDFESARKLWSALEQRFQAARNPAGRVFALLEQAYVFGRISKPQECLASAAAAAPVVRQHGYAWIEAQLQLELSTCYGLAGQFERKYAALEAASRIAQEQGFRTTEQRALGFRASAMRQMGAFRASLDLDGQSVRDFLTESWNAGRAYQFYYGLASAASSTKYFRAAAAFASQAVRLAPSPTIGALVRASYAEILADAGHLEDSAREFARSADFFEAQKNSSSTRLYRAYSRIAEARAAGRQGNVQRGLEALAPMEAELPAIRNTVVEARFWLAKSQLLANAGRSSESVQALHKVLGLSAAASTGAAPALAQIVSDAIRLLVDRDLQQEPAGILALEDWDRYFPAFRTVGKDAVRLTYADLPSGLVVWAATKDKVRCRRLAISAEVVRAASRDFSRLLASSGSASAVEAGAQRLYTQLMGPVESEIGTHGTLYISADDSFSQVPFGALSANGDWVADRFDVVYSPPLLGGIEPHAGSVTTKARLLAVSAGQSARVFQFNLPALQDVSRDLPLVAHAFERHTLLAGENAQRKAMLEELKHAEVLHFAGHAVVASGGGALVLSSAQDSGDGRLLWARDIPRESLADLQLAVLAACSTNWIADGDTQSGSGIARSFLLAGVPQVIASRWDVDSRATAVLMKAFYERLPAAASVEVAWSAAIRQLRDQRTFAHPYYWAAFDLLRL
jgi:CHAT domain-containing protein